MDLGSSGRCCIICANILPCRKSGNPVPRWSPQFFCRIRYKLGPYCLTYLTGVSLIRVVVIQRDDLNNNINSRSVVVQHPLPSSTTHGMQSQSSRLNLKRVSSPLSIQRLLDQVSWAKSSGQVVGKLSCNSTTRVEWPFGAWRRCRQNKTERLKSSSWNLY